jgi:Lysylphosphatidylglycerol synthase TM region
MSGTGASRGTAAEATDAPRRSRRWRKAIPYAGTALIFALIFWKVPLGQVGAALEQAPVLWFIAIFLPYSLFYFAIDSFCLTWVVRRFNAPMTWGDMLPIRASMYLLALINTNLGQGGVAYYLHRKARIGFLGALSSVLFIALLEIYQLFLFSTLGVIFYTPTGATQIEIVRILRVSYVIAWTALGGIIVFFAAARRSPSIREWVETSRFGAIAATFMRARPLDYLAVLAIKAPSFLGSVVAQYFALALYGIAVPFLKLMLFLPLVFLAAALPIAVAHLGTSQAAWLLFFSANASEVRILAYSLAAHFTFMFCNGLIGLVFLPRASRELTALGDDATRAAAAN